MALDAVHPIDWATLTHAKGPATDIPEILKRIAFPAEAVRREAIQELMGRLAANRLVWEATPAAVPLLVELLGTPRVGDKDWILMVLGHFAHSLTRTPLPEVLTRHLPGEPLPVGPDEGWLTATRLAVDSGSVAYLPFLDHDNPMHRAAAAYALSCCGRDPAPIAQALRNRLKSEPTDLVRAALLFALHQVGDMMDGPLYREYLPGQLGPLAGWAAAAGLLLHWEKQAEPEAIEVLLRAISTPGPLRSMYRMFPWGSGELHADTGQILSRATPKAAESIVPRLIHVFGTAGPEESLTLAFAILELTFPKGALATANRPLSELQRTVLSTFAHSHRLGSESPLKQVLESRGLPSSRAELLALSAPGTS